MARSQSSVRYKIQKRIAADLLSGVLRRRSRLKSRLPMESAYCSRVLLVGRRSGMIGRGSGILSVNASLEKTRNSLKIGGQRGLLFMLRCDRIPVMRILVSTVSISSTIASSNLVAAMHLAKTVLALFLATSAVETWPQATSDIPTTKTHSGKTISSERLLERGYLLSKELPPNERVWLLTELIMPSSKWHPGLIRPWTEEMFRLALQLSRGRVVTQKNAATAMSWIDIQRALQMLDECEPPGP